MLKVDRPEFACIRFLILFNPGERPSHHYVCKHHKYKTEHRLLDAALSVSDVKELEEHRFVESVQEQVRGALLEYTLTSRFTHLLLCLSDLRSLGSLAEHYLHCRHLSGELPCNNLLSEMLHAKCSWT